MLHNIIYNIYGVSRAKSKANSDIFLFKVKFIVLRDIVCQFWLLFGELLQYNGIHKNSIAENSRHLKFLIKIISRTKKFFNFLFCAFSY